jgi:hypothetical protein
MPNERFYVVDRIEGELVVLLEDDTGERVNMDSWELPLVDEGMVLRVTIQNDKPKWGTATIDEEETARRKGDAEQTLADLRKRDPGGDIAT